MPLRRVRSPYASLRPKRAHSKTEFVRIIARRTLREFVDSLAGKKDQPAVKAALDAWFHEVSKARQMNAECRRGEALICHGEHRQFGLYRV